MGNANQSADARSAVDDELTGLLSRAGDFALENTINETHRIIQVIEEVGNPGADTHRHNRRVSVCHRTQRVGVELVVETEGGPVQALPGIVRLRHRNVGKIGVPSRKMDGNGFGGGMVSCNRAHRKAKEEHKDSKYRVIHELEGTG